MTEEFRVLTDDEDHAIAKVLNALPNSLSGLYKEPEPWPAGKLKVTAVMDNGAITIEVLNPPTKQAEQILRHVLPRVLELFLVKNKDYADWPDLGVRGEFVEIWRKTHKLKRALWDNQELVSEQWDEIIMDMVGHCLLALKNCP